MALTALWPAISLRRDNLASRRNKARARGRGDAAIPPGHVAATQTNQINASPLLHSLQLRKSGVPPVMRQGTPAQVVQVTQLVQLKGMVSAVG